MIEVQFFNIPVLWDVTLCKIAISYQSVGVPYFATVLRFR